MNELFESCKETIIDGVEGVVYSIPLDSVTINLFDAAYLSTLFKYNDEISVIFLGYTLDNNANIFIDNNTVKCLQALLKLRDVLLKSYNVVKEVFTNINEAVNHVIDEYKEQGEVYTLSRLEYDRMYHHMEHVAKSNKKTIDDVMLTVLNYDDKYIVAIANQYVQSFNKFYNRVKMWK